MAFVTDSRARRDEKSTGFQDAPLNRLALLSQCIMRYGVSQKGLPVKVPDLVVCANQNRMHTLPLYLKQTGIRYIYCSNKR